MAASFSSSSGNQYTDEQNVLFTRVTRYFDNRFETLSTQIQTDRNEIMKRLDQLGETPISTAETKTNIETKLDNLDARLTNVETELATVKTELQEVKAGLQEVKAENQTLRTEMNEMNQRLDRVENTGLANHQMLQVAIEQFSRINEQLGKINRKLGID